MKEQSIPRKDSRVKSIFFRLFASIMAITVLILIIQVVVISIMLQQQSKQFAQEVFLTYEQRLRQLLDLGGSQDGGVWTLQSLGPALRMAADDRISGLILRDEQERIVLSLGKMPRGIVVGDDPPLQTPSGRISLPNRDWYVGPTLSLEFTRTEDDDTSLNGLIMPNYPAPPIRAHDIVGTIPIYSDAERQELLGFVDVLVLSPMNYAMTALLLRRMVSGFGITILIALVIAFFGSHIIARTVSRHAAVIVRSLGDIAQGRYDGISYRSTMTELSQIAESVEALKRQLAGHERMRQQWLRGIAHDLNTPVTALKLSIESALDHVVPLDALLLKRMRKEHDELERRVSAVMTLASMESPDFRMEHNGIDVLDFVDEVISSSLVDRRLVLNIQVDQISGDRRLLVLVARELVNNACKYAVEGTPIEWAVEYGEGSEEFVMRFRNTGFLAKDTIDHVFEPWYRADESRSQSGSGMGLAIVRQVLEAHGGSVTMYQEEMSVIVVLCWPNALPTISAN